MRSPASLRSTERASEDAELDACDTSLVTRARAGDEGAYAALVRRHLPAALAVARAITGHAADAEDVCQDAFAAVLGRLERCRPDTFRAWLLRCVRNRAVSHRRWRRVRAAVALGTAPGEHDPPSGAENPHAAAERADLRARLEAALATLPDWQRAVVILHDVEGWRHREIGAALGIAAGTSRVRLFDARRRLRAQLEVLCDAAALSPCSQSAS